MKQSLGCHLQINMDAQTSMSCPALLLADSSNWRPQTSKHLPHTKSPTNQDPLVLLTSSSAFLGGPSSGWRLRPCCSPTHQPFTNRRLPTSVQLRGTRAPSTPPGREVRSALRQKDNKQARKGDKAYEHIIHCFRMHHESFTAERPRSLEAFPSSLHPSACCVGGTSTQGIVPAGA